MVTVEVDGQPVAVKLARHDGSLVNAQPEYDDVARAAAALGRPVLDVLADAAAASRAFLRQEPCTRMDLVVIALDVRRDLRRSSCRTRRSSPPSCWRRSYRPLLVWIGVGLAFTVQTSWRCCSATP